jgi:hypothetical protein
MMKRTLSLLLSSLALVASVGVVATTTAPAANATPDRSSVSALVIATKSAPSCVKRSVSGNKRSVTVTNNCGIPVRINVKFTRSPDTGCYILWQDKKKKHSRPWPAKYSGTSSCGAWP